MEIIGTIKIVQELQSGTSQAGNAYKRQTIVIEYGDRYPKELALTLMNDKCDTYSRYLAPGQQFKFYFDASSREYNGRYYTECMIWKIERPQAQPQQTYQAPAPAPMPAAAPMPQPQQAYAPQPATAPMPNYAPASAATPQTAFNPYPPIPTSTEELPF